MAAAGVVVAHAFRRLESMRRQGTPATSINVEKERPRAPQIVRRKHRFVMFYDAPDKTIMDGRGRIIFFSLPRFISDIASGNHCFICGAEPGRVPFNDEHVIPDWILRRFKLHARDITLPNGTLIPYGQFKVPCCEECNTSMGARLEGPISDLFARGQDALHQELKVNGPWRLFCWMSLIFLKTHLKDTYLSLNRDGREEDFKIGELHSWEDLHHVHCVARAFYSGCDIPAEVVGSILVLPAKVRTHLEPFDYADLSFAQTMLLRVDETAIIAVFNDSGAALSIFGDRVKRIDGPLSPLQLRELTAEFASLNIQLSERPRFSSDLNLLTEEYKIVAHRPESWSLEKWDPDVRAKIMGHICEPLLSLLPEKDEIVEKILTGRYTFLVDDEGMFIRDHMELAP